MSYVESIKVAKNKMILCLVNWTYVPRGIEKSVILSIFFFFNFPLRFGTLFIFGLTDFHKTLEN